MAQLVAIRNSSKIFVPLAATALRDRAQRLNAFILKSRTAQRGSDLHIQRSLADGIQQIGFTNFDQGEREQYPPSPQRLVRTHPGSKRKTLYLSAHASHVVGWPVGDGRLLLSDLNAHATHSTTI